MTRVLLAVAVVWTYFASACDRFPTVVVENDTDASVVAVSDDFPADQETIPARSLVEMAPLSRKGDATYVISHTSGEVVGCVTARFKGAGDKAHVRVSEAVPCPANR